MPIPNTSIVHHNHENIEDDIAAQIMRAASAFVGAGYGIYGAVQVTELDLGSFPYVSTALANDVPLLFYAICFVFFSISGTINNYYNHFGRTIDILIDWCKSCPKEEITLEKIKEWLKSKDVTNVTDFLFLLLGLALSGVFIYYSAKNKGDFHLPFNANRNVPDRLLELNAPLMLSGALANLISYLFEGLLATLRIGMHGANWVVPELKSTLPSVFFKPNIPNHKAMTFANGFIIIGALTGLGFGLNAAIHLEKKYLNAFPYLSTQLASNLPLGFDYWLVPLLVGGTFANYYSHLGIAIDVLCEIKTFPFRGTRAEIKEWLFSCNIKNGAHVFGALFGAALAATFMYYNATENDAFDLPFNADINVPKWIMQLFAIFYISGACSNIFSYFTESAKEIITGKTFSLYNVGSKIKSFLPTFSIFGGNANNQSASSSTTRSSPISTP